MHVEELGNRSYFLLPGNLTTDSFPALPDEGLTVTFDRRRALARENVGFLTPDHPMVRAALDLLLGSEAGNSSFGLWRGAGAEGLMLETHFVVECVAPAALHADRFLPAIPVRVVVDHTKKDRRKDAAYRHMRTEKGSPSRLLENAGIKHKLFPAMLARARQLAETELAVLAETAVKAARAQLGDEIVRPEEIEALRAQQSALEQALGDARLRLDAVRLVLQAA
jgi:ATP-dependent helicase HepA